MRTHLIKLAAGIALVVGALLVPATASAAVPGNDDFANAVAISSLPFSDSVDTTQATTEPGEQLFCSSGSHTVWYAITPTKEEILRVDASASSFFDNTVTVYRQQGSGLGGLSAIACSSFPGRVTFKAQQGTTYYIQANDSFTGGGDLQLSVQEIPPPPNDDFANASVVTSLPFADNVDVTAAGLEAGEPAPSCAFGGQTGSIWYAITPTRSGSLSASIPSASVNSVMGAYTGSSLGALKEVGCRQVGFFGGGVMTFHADAGTTYYIQVLTYGNGSLQFGLDVAPAPVASFFFFPSAPSSFDVVSFIDTSQDPGQAGFSETWSFGDASTGSGNFANHRYAADGDYTAKLTITTTDGRTASSSQVVHVRTHDVAIAKVTVPNAASVGQTRSISVGLKNTRYPETVQVQLLKSVAGGGWQQVGVLTHSVPVLGGNRTTSFDFNYTFAPEDAAVGKITFQAVATIQGAADAVPGDNTFISLPTRVNR